MLEGGCFVKKFADTLTGMGYLVANFLTPAVAVVARPKRGFHAVFARMAAYHLCPPNRDDPPVMTTAKLRMSADVSSRSLMHTILWVQSRF
jgi:hypothetical protein